MSKMKVLISAPYFQPVLKRFKKTFQERRIEIIAPKVKERLEEKDLLKIIEDIDGVICGDDQFTERVLKKATRLKIIAKWGTGIDSIDQAACRKYKVILKNTPNAFTDPVADSVMSYILSFARKTPWQTALMKKKIWEKVPGVALKEATLGIIGVGNIGKAVARRAAAFGMTVLGNDIKEVDPVFLKDLSVKMVEKDEIYKSADFISLNCDLNPTTYHLVRQETFRQMVRKPFIINTSRGAVIKEKDLVRALKKGVISGAALDVFEKEPLPKDSPLLKMDDVLLAAHNSNSSPGAWEYVHQNTLNNLLEGLTRDEK